MCLVINKNVKLPKVQKDGYCIGYKVICTNDVSLYRWYRYFIGENNSSREDTFLTPDESSFGKVSHGFHIFLRLRTTKNAMYFKSGYYNFSSTRKIIKVFYKPEDVVALGTWDKPNTSHNVVVTKMLIKSLDHICKVKEEKKQP